MINPRSLQQEIDENFASFMHVLPSLLPTQRGRFALLHDRQITGFYDTIRDAQMAASSLYGEGLYSIQQVTDAAGDLGFFSHAVHLGSP